MNREPSPESFRFRAAIGRSFGLGFCDQPPEALDRILSHAAARVNASHSDYIHRLESNRLTPEEFKTLLNEVTVGETYFFRHPDQFRALHEVALPSRVRTRGHDKRLSVLSAGCASGEEAYSLAAALLESLDPSSWSLSVVGLDLNPTSLRKANEGRYTSWSLRATSDELRQRYFQQSGRDFVVTDSLRRLTSFQSENLAAPAMDARPSGEFDVVFFRNVMMYFTDEAAALVVARLTRWLAPGGYLFLGPAETLRGLSHDFHLRHTHDSFYYQLRDDAPKKPSRLASYSGAPTVSPNWSRPPALDLGSQGSLGDGAHANPTTPPAHIAAEAWMTAIEQSTERVARLSRDVHASRRRMTPATPPDPQAPAASPVDAAVALAEARGLMEQERFDDARRLMEKLSPEVLTLPGTQLLLAVALTNSGAHAEAQIACENLLAGDELNPEGHYLFALCCEQSGNLAAAVEHNETACYLDPQFAMPRLHLGRLAKRRGQREAAARAFNAGLTLLAAEEPSRIALFGGGFSREALTQVFLAELKVCGGRRG